MNCTVESMLVDSSLNLLPLLVSPRTRSARYANKIKKGSQMMVRRHDANKNAKQLSQSEDAQCPEAYKVLHMRHAMESAPVKNITSLERSDVHISDSP